MLGKCPAETGTTAVLWYTGFMDTTTTDRNSSIVVLTTTRRSNSARARRAFRARMFAGMAAAAAITFEREPQVQSVVGEPQPPRDFHMYNPHKTNGNIEPAWSAEEFAQFKAWRQFQKTGVAPAPCETPTAHNLWKMCVCFGGPVRKAT
jgi:hypothetical protein